MEPRKRTHLVNALTDEANLMIAVLKKAIEGERREAIPPVLRETPPQRDIRLEEEHNAWEKIRQALTDIQTALDHIEHAEHQRIAPS